MVHVLFTTVDANKAMPNMPMMLRVLPMRMLG